MKRLGVIVNPVAGIGGRVGLKGSDGFEIRCRARELGARPESPRRAVEALKTLSRLGDAIRVVTYPGEMGEDECREAGLGPEVIGSIVPGETTPQDTREAARLMLAEGVDLLLFAGGDGTARDTCDAVGARLPAIGIPSGVKIHSAVYAVTPRRAGETAALFLEGRLPLLREAEVMDIDEEAFRKGVLTARLYGYLRVPEESSCMQSRKAGSVSTEADALAGIAADVIESMDDPACFYVLGPGTTTRAIGRALCQPTTLLGVDLLRDRRLVAADVSEQELVSRLRGHKAKIVVTVIGGQGHVFGRGNQQLSPEVIGSVNRDDIVVIATASKLASLCGRPLLLDTGDDDLDRKLSGYVRVTTGYRQYVMCRLAC